MFLINYKFRFRFYRARAHVHVRVYAHDGERECVSRQILFFFVANMRYRLELSWWHLFLRSLIEFKQCDVIVIWQKSRKKSIFYQWQLRLLLSLFLYGLYYLNVTIKVEIGVIIYLLSFHCYRLLGSLFSFVLKFHAPLRLNFRIHYGRYERQSINSLTPDDDMNTDCLTTNTGIIYAFNSNKIKTDFISFFFSSVLCMTNMTTLTLCIQSDDHLENACHTTNDNFRT